MTKNSLIYKITLVILEFFSIVLGVLLALAAKDWYTEKETKQLVENSLSTLYAEISDNREAVVVAHTAHAERLSMLLEALEAEDSMTEIDADRVFEEIDQQGILKPANLQNADTAWVTAKLSGVVQKFPYGHTLLFSRVYALQKNYQVRTEKAMASLPSTLDDEIDPILRLKEIYENINDLWWIETNMIETYDDALATRDKPANSKVELAPAQ